MRNAAAEPNRTRLIADVTIAPAWNPVGKSSSGAATADRCSSHFTSGTSPPAARQPVCPAREPGSTPTKTGEFQSRKPCSFGTSSGSEMKFSRHQIWLQCLHDHEIIAVGMSLASLAQPPSGPEPRSNEIVTNTLNRFASELKLSADQKARL